MPACKTYAPPVMWATPPGTGNACSSSNSPWSLSVCCVICVLESRHRFLVMIRTPRKSILTSSISPLFLSRFRLVSHANYGGGQVSMPRALPSFADHSTLHSPILRSCLHAIPGLHQPKGNPKRQCFHAIKHRLRSLVMRH
jgi:hypothetical protein